MSLADGNRHVIVSIRRFPYALLIREVPTITVRTGLPDEAAKLRKIGPYRTVSGIREFAGCVGLHKLNHSDIETRRKEPCQISNASSCVFYC